MRLYLKFMAIHLKSAMEYKTSFFLTSIGQFLISFTSFLGLYYLLARFQDVQGFSFREVLLCYSAVLCAYAIAECFSYGFKSFAQTLSNGQFDQVMIRPRSELFLVFVSAFEFSSVGKLVQAVLVMIYALLQSPVLWTPQRVLVYIAMTAGGIFLFMGLYLIYAGLCFFTIEGLEFINIFTDGGREFGKYPMSVYGPTVLKLFTFLVPLACVQYYPLLYLLGRTDSMCYALTPLYTLLFFAVSVLVWKHGVKNYKSTGS